MSAGIGDWIVVVERTERIEFRVKAKQDERDQLVLGCLVMNQVEPNRPYPDSVTHWQTPAKTDWKIVGIEDRNVNVEPAF